MSHNFEYTSDNIFNVASRTITKSMQDKREIVDECDKEIALISDEDIFCGPIHDNCIEQWNNISKYIAYSINSCRELIPYLESARNNYVSSDTKNANNIVSM